ncbi:MAG: hypothetical protein ACRCTZ_08470 [Sarcina sp.]
MFKKIISVSLLLSLFSLVGCQSNKKTDVVPITYDVELDLSESTIFSEEEINNAIQGIKNDFNLHYSDGELLKIQYDDKSSDFYVNEHLRLFPKKKLKKENTIAFSLSLDTGNSENILLSFRTKLFSQPCVLSKNKKGQWTIESV